MQSYRASLYHKTSQRGYRFDTRNKIFPSKYDPIPYVPKKITIGLSASITSKVLNESKYDFRV